MAKIESYTTAIPEELGVGVPKITTDVRSTHTATLHNLPETATDPIQQ